MSSQITSASCVQAKQVLEGVIHSIIKSMRSSNKYIVNLIGFSVVDATIPAYLTIHILLQEDIMYKKPICLNIDLKKLV